VPLCGYARGKSQTLACCCRLGGRSAEEPEIHPSNSTSSIEQSGVRPRGNRVNERLESSNPAIYPAADCADLPQLAPTAASITGLSRACKCCRLCRGLLPIFQKVLSGLSGTLSRCGKARGGSVVALQDRRATPSTTALGAARKEPPCVY